MYKFTFAACLILSELKNIINLKTTTKMNKLQYCLVKDNQISEILYSLSHRRNTPVIGVCSGQKMKNFYKLININANYSSQSIHLMTQAEFIANASQAEATVLLMCAPSKFEEMAEIMEKAQSQSQNVVLMILEVNKKYINILSKKVQGLEAFKLEYSQNKFVGINDKIRDFVDKNYDMNRAAFYAYGEYINFYRANPLKKIFRSELINLDQLARSFGFTAAQRVKQGNFLKESAKNRIAATKKAEKRQKKRDRKNQPQPIEQEVATKQAQPLAKNPLKKAKKIKKTDKPAKVQAVKEKLTKKKIAKK